MVIADHFIGGNFRFILQVGYFVRSGNWMEIWAVSVRSSKTGIIFGAPTI